MEGTLADDLVGHALEVVLIDGVDPCQHLGGIDRAAFDDLAPESKGDQPLRALELKNKPALQVLLGLRQLACRHRLADDAAKLGDDRLDRLVDPIEIDAGLCAQRSRLGVGVVVAEDVVGQAAPLPDLGEQA